jgi:ATP-dependent DNA ligase
MQAMLVDSIRPGDWIYEIKFDGYRALALRGGNETRILSRSTSTITRACARFREMAGLEVSAGGVSFIRPESRCLRADP